MISEERRVRRPTPYLKGRRGGVERRVRRSKSADFDTKLCAREAVAAQSCRPRPTQKGRSKSAPGEMGRRKRQPYEERAEAPRYEDLGQN